MRRTRTTDEESLTQTHTSSAPRVMALTRRTVLSAIGGALATTPFAGTVGCEEGACSEFPELTEGPYYVDGPSERADITEGLDGAPFTMRFTVLDTNCQPIEGAVVDVWHAAPDGTYSGVEDAEGEMYLRGVQPTDAEGVATFQSVVAGWYRGRTTHVHFKVFVDDSEVITSQAFFPEDTLSSIYATGAYASRGDKDTANDDDEIFNEADSESTIFEMEDAGGGAWSGALTVNVSV